MRIAKSALIDPERNEIYGMTAVALSFFVFAYSSRFGQISVLAYYGMWLPLVVVDYRRVLGNYPRYLWIFAFGILTVLSSFWSEAASVTMRASIQYMTHIVCALIAMRVISIRTLTRGALIGIAVVLLYSLLFGIYLFDALDGTYSFVGAFSSKNQLGFMPRSASSLPPRRCWCSSKGASGCRLPASPGSCQPIASLRRNRPHPLLPRRRWSPSSSASFPSACFRRRTER